MTEKLELMKDNGIQIQADESEEERQKVRQADGQKDRQTKRYKRWTKRIGQRLKDKKSKYRKRQKDKMMSTLSKSTLLVLGKIHKQYGKLCKYYLKEPYTSPCKYYLNKPLGVLEPYSSP